MMLSCKSFSSFCLFGIHFLYFSLLPVSALLRNNETDRLALLEFKAKITDDPLSVMTSWNSSLHFCQWYGVKCGRRHQRVTVLDLSSLKLSGSVSPHIGNLSFLMEFALQNNSFSHEIPPHIGHLRRLKKLSLFNNSFTGQIPSTISNCSNLVFIYLNGNNLAGEIPTWIGSLTKLKEIYLGLNNLSGPLPPSLGNLSSLEKFRVGGNQLYGNLPHSLGQLKNLKILAIYGNHFWGTIPSSIYNLSSIDSIDASVNNLQGKLPLGIGISLLPKLKFFSISTNQFSGIIPSSISNASNLESLQLSLNNFTGAVPSFEKLHKLVYLTLGMNNLGSAGKANGDLKFLSTLTNATALEMLDLGANNFGGELPEHISNLSKKLHTFRVQNNQISGSIPAGIFSLENLQAFFAGSNKLSGTIPSSIGKIQNLHILSLQHNKFLGGIPSSLGNLTKLLIIDLSNNNLQGMIPSSLGNCKKLIAIDLGRNNLSGSIPSKLFELPGLSLYFGVSENRLSGFLPNEVGNLKNLELLGLGGNMLSGEIPASLGSCTSLEGLDMGHNNFQGSIASSLSLLRGITELDVSHNNLSGKIPEFLKDFRLIELLDLSYNEFEGRVPTEGVFKNATATSLAGNKNLCGGIPAFRLPACKSEQSKKRLSVKLKIIIFAVVVSVLISVTFVIIVLFICHSRKRKGQSISASHQGKDFFTCSYRSLFKATNGFSSDNLIGMGGFGSVYKGILDQEGIAIAVKVFNLQHRGASKSFIAECAAIRNIRHRNLVKVLTACSGIDYHGNDFKALVYEFMSNGSLDDWLHPTVGLDEEPRTLNFQQRLNIAMDVARALEYLHHHCEIPIVHCDLKPSNVLLNEEMIGHISDFGLVKFLSDGMFDYSTNQSSSIGIRGTIGYCPPEHGVGSEVSTSSDVFSFGILLLEIFTGKRPIDFMFQEDLTLRHFVKMALPERVTEVIDPNLLWMMQLNDLTECFISVFEIGISCSAESPQQRPNIGDVTTQLSSIKNKLQYLWREN